MYTVSTQAFAIDENGKKHNDTVTIFSVDANSSQEAELKVDGGNYDEYVLSELQKQKSFQGGEIIRHEAVVALGEDEDLDEDGFGFGYDD